ncbi:MAG: ABC transporter permease subunit [Defluviitaleaceae bacterium]|nr:ABC transporter permease subunit [Defluviitaleaceae bacterium]
MESFKLESLRFFQGKRGKRIYQQRYLLLMSIPFAAWCFAFMYLPLFGWIMAFQNFRLMGRVTLRSFWEAEWIGLANFRELFADERFYTALRNTLGMSFLGITIGFVVPIIFALLINEMRVGLFKRFVQTVSYMPHFISWVVAAGMITFMLATTGPLNSVLIAVGLIDRPIAFLSTGEMFWGIITGSEIWKSTGWNAIIFLAAISGIDLQLYEAAEADGAGRFKKMWHVTLPGISNVIIVILIMNIGWLMNVGFERQMLLGNPAIREWAEVLDVYILRFGIGTGRFSYGTAIGIFRSVVSIMLLLAANGIARKTGRGGVI